MSQCEGQVITTRGMPVTRGREHFSNVLVDMFSSVVKKVSKMDLLL